MDRFNELYLRFKPEITLAAVVLVFSTLLSLSFHMGTDVAALETGMVAHAPPEIQEQPPAAPAPVVQTPTDPVIIEPAPPTEQPVEELTEPVEDAVPVDEVAAATPAPDIDTDAEDADVLVTEVVYGTIDGDSITVDRSDGKVRIRNDGTRDRIWDINLYIEDQDKTSFEVDVMHVPELKPGAQEELPYDVTLDKSPILVTETYDADADMKGTQAYMVYGDDTTFELTITLTNPQEFSLEVDLTKPAPEGMTSVRLDASSGEAQYDEETHLFTWKGSLEPAETVELILAGKVSVDNEEVFTMEPGTLSVTADDLFSHMKLVRSEGMSSNRFAIDKRQDAKNSDKWYVTVFLKNLSEFDCRVNQVDIHENGMEAGLLERFMPDELLEPGATWEADFVVQSADVPALGHRTSITMLPGIVTRQKGEFKFGGLEVDVARAAISKEIDRAVLKLGEKEKVGVVIFVESLGPAPIHSITVEDEVPAGFDIRDIKVEFEDHTIRKDITSDTTRKKGDGTITFIVDDIADAFGKDMERGDFFEITYELVSTEAIEGTYETDVWGHANTDPAGTPIPLEAVEDVPLMKVTKGLQGIFMSKDLVSTLRDDEIKFVIYMKNKGHVPMEDLVVRDLFPDGFDLVSSSEEYEIVHTTEKGVVAQWTVDRLEVDAEHELTYVLRGSGDYSISDAVVMIGG